MTLRIDADGASLAVADDIEQRRCVLHLPEPAAVEPVDGDSFYFPVDTAVRVESPSVTLGNFVGTFVRDESGTVLSRLDQVDERSFEEGVYSVELDHVIKLYVTVRGSMRIETTGLTTTVETDGELLVGARSRHTLPAGTITTTAEPRDVMRAISAFSSSLKTTSVERSYPTLRGHPPELVLGEELDVPEAFRSPETGVRIEVPPRLRFVYTVASLAFYLGADVVPGEAPRIVGEDGFRYSLDGPRGFERTVERTLEQVVLFDCVARTEGFYELDLEERRRVDELVDLDWVSLYDRSLTDQLRSYLSVPYERISAFVPAWKTTTYLDPTPKNAELLPFLVDDLAHVRLPAGERTSVTEVQSSSLLEFTRTNADPPGADGELARTDAGFTRSVSASTQRRSTSPPRDERVDALVQPAETDSVEVVWAADEMPVGATKASIAGYRNGLEHSPSDEIGVTVVVNDAEMAEEGAVASDVYGDDAEYPLDLRVYENLSTDALRAVLETERDFIHYVGHIESDGFECADGRLDVRDLESVGVDAFFLNACASYEQGMALLEAGAVGGVVTVSEVLNSGATRVGTSMVNLLNRGFPLRPALDIAKGASFVGGQYAIVGDGDVDVVQRDNLGATIVEVEPIEDGYDISTRVYPTADLQVGSFSRITADPNERFHLSPGRFGPFEQSRADTVSMLERISDPVRIGEKLHWSVDGSELR